MIAHAFGMLCVPEMHPKQLASAVKERRQLSRGFLSLFAGKGFSACSQNVEASLVRRLSTKCVLGRICERGDDEISEATALQRANTETSGSSDRKPIKQTPVPIAVRYWCIRHSMNHGTATMRVVLWTGVVLPLCRRPRASRR